MPRLIHLNGPPGIGKSTLAQLYVDRHPGVLNLDIDLLRVLVGGWQDRFEETGQVVRPIALSMAHTHLRAGYDVVMPQYLRRISEIERFETAAHEGRAEFREVLLMDSKERSIQRFTGRRSELHWHLHVNEYVDRNGGDALLGAMHDGLADVVRTRPQVVVVPSVAAAVEQTYTALIAALDGR